MALPEPYASGRGWTLYAGDCLEVMAELPSEHFCGFVMDPPFTAAGGSTNGRSEGHEADTQFFRHWLRDVYAAVRAVCAPDGCGFTFCDWQTIGVVKSAMSAGTRGTQTAPVWQVSQALVWDRESMGLGSPFRNSWEMVAFARGPKWQSALPKNIHNLLRERWPYGAHENHGAEKPTALVKRLVEWATLHNPDGVLLDPFTGSGTVGVAALQAGRRVVLIEQDAGCLEVAARRLRAAQESGAPVPMFGGAL